jgi:hypothetical protein
MNAPGLAHQIADVGAWLALATTSWMLALAGRRLRECRRRLDELERQSDGGRWLMWKLAQYMGLKLPPPPFPDPFEEPKGPLS